MKKNKEKNKDVISQAHDIFFRTIMQDKRVARDFLENHLPPDLLKITDLSVLEAQPRSFIDDVRRESIVDVLFKTKINGKEGFIYLLVEHQSRPDKLMPLRVIKYTINVINDYTEKNDSETFPLIYPVVVYHGKKEWKHSNDINDLVDSSRELIDQYFLKPFHLVDLSKIPDEELKNHTWAGIAEFALKHIFERDVLPWVRQIISNMRNVINQDGANYVELVLEYFMERGDLSSKQEYIDMINKEISSEMGDAIMSYIDKIKQEVKQETIQQIAIAINLLKEGSEIGLVAKITNLKEEEVKKLNEQLSH